MGYHQNNQQRIEDLPLFAALGHQESPTEAAAPREPTPTPVAPIQPHGAPPVQPSGQPNGAVENGDAGEVGTEADPAGMTVTQPKKIGRPRTRGLVAPQQHVPPSESKMERNAKAVLAYLEGNAATSEETAIPGRTIVQALGLGGTNTLRYATKWLRENGHLVVATISDGYFIATSPDAVRNYIERNIGNRIASYVAQTEKLAAQASRKWGAPEDLIDVYMVTRVPLARIPDRLID